MTTQSHQRVPIADAMRLAIDHHQAGRLREAESIYRAVLESAPDHAGANYNLGLVALQTGRAQDGVPVLKAALNADPTNAACWMNYAVALVANGDAEAARITLTQARHRGLGGQALVQMLATVERMLESRDPRYTRAPGAAEAEATGPELSLLDRLFREGRYAEVEAAASRECARFPHLASVWRLLGAARLAHGDSGGAFEALSRAHELAPRDPAISNLLGLALHRLVRYEQADQMFALSLALAPGSYETLVNASANAHSSKDFPAARRYAEQALGVRPEGAEALMNLGNAVAASGKASDAVELYRRAIALGASGADLLANLGNALTTLGKADEAAATLQRAVSLQPEHAFAHLNLARALHDLGETALARTHFRAASDIDPALAEAHSAYLFSLAHDERVSPEEGFAEHLRIGDLIERPLKSRLREHENDRDPDRELRIGFVSGDLHNHPVAYLVEPIWQAMKQGGNRIVAYSNFAADDPVRDRLRSIADEWVEVERLNDEALCERIRADRIDVLFDLSGHTAHNRLTAFALKPAPVQVSWIGYPGTTGLSAMDYRFVRGLDAAAGSMEQLFREKLVYFRSRGFQPEPSAPSVNRLPSLTRGHITFGSFNRPSKLGESVIALWSRVLKAIPDARMLIAGVSETRLKTRLIASFSAHGINQDRIEFRPRVPMAQYLAMHHEVDIALDTFPYTGGTTSSHALWMGIPVLTLAGQTLQQNQTAAIVRMVGLGEWVADSQDAFVRQACAAASDLNGLDQLRQGLRERVGRVFQGSLEDLGRELDVAFRTIWRRWCAGLPPESFAVVV